MCCDIGDVVVVVVVECFGDVWIGVGGEYV